MDDQNSRPVRVWDLPTRLFHWTLAIALIFSVVSAKTGGNAMVWHFRCGYLILTLLGFRIVWGLVGGRWSRFASFIYAPATLLRYLRGAARPGEHLDVGHSPLGAFSVFGLLAILLLQVSTGLFADDEIASAGPLTALVSGATVKLATGWHKQYGQWIVIALALMHIAAVLFYLFAKKRNLIVPMVSGDKALAGDVPAAADGARQRLIALIVVAAAAAGVAWIVGLGG